jgi:hypothetical protein
VVFDLVKLCDQYWVARLHNHCLHQLFNGITVSRGMAVQAQQSHGQQKSKQQKQSKQRRDEAP